MAVVLLLAVAGILRLHMARDGFLHSWDERYHALVAKNLMDNPWKPVLYADPALPYDHRHWTANHVWLHKPPLALWLMALSMATFGVNELAMRLPNLLHSTLAVALTFAIGRRLFDDRAALLAAALHATNGYLLELAGGRTASDHVESLMITIVAAGVYLAIKDGRRPRWILAAAIGALTGFGYLTKWYVALLIPAIWVVAAWRSTPRRALSVKLVVILLTAALIALPWEAHVRSAFPEEAAWERAYNWRHFSETLEGHRHPPLYYFQRMGRAFGELAFIPVAWFFWRVLSGKLGRGWPIVVWFALPYAIFSFAQTKMPGYVAVAAPAVFLMMSCFAVHLYDHLGALSQRIVLRRAAIALLALLFLLPLRTGLERMKIVGGYERNPEWARKLRGLGPKLSTQKAVLFGVEHPIEAMFYTSAIAYPRQPLEEEVQLLHQRGYEVLVFKRAEAEVP